MRGPRALASPASLKGVLAARDAAAALEDGFAHVGVSCVQQPLADGGEGTIAALCEEWASWSVHDAFGRTRSAAVGDRDDAVVVEAAQVLPFDLLRLDVMAATSRGLGELLARLEPSKPVLVGLGGTANMDGGAGLLEALDALPAPTTVLCDVATTLYDAPRLFGPLRRTPICRARARQGGSGQHSPRSARSSSPARLPSSTCSASTRARTGWS